MSASEAVRVAGAAALLAHPLRVRMLVHWPQGQRMTARLVALGLDCKLSEAAYHLRVLCDGGALEMVGESPSGEPQFRAAETGRRLAMTTAVLARAAEGSHLVQETARAVDAERNDRAQPDPLTRDAADTEPAPEATPLASELLPAEPEPRAGAFERGSGYRLGPGDHDLAGAAGTGDVQSVAGAAAAGAA